MRTRHSWASLYDIFLASSPKVREKFAHSDFSRQKAARQTSFHAMLTTAKDGAAAPGQNLNDLAERHSSRQLNIGRSSTTCGWRACWPLFKSATPQYDEPFRDAWERVMVVGIGYLLSRY